MFYRIGIIFLLITTCFTQNVVAAAKYSYVKKEEIGATTGSGVIFKGRLYLLGKSAYSTNGFFIDVYNLKEPSQHKKTKRIQLDSEARFLKVSEDLLMIEHASHITLMRLDDIGEKVIGRIPVNATASFSYSAAIHKNKVATRVSERIAASLPGKVTIEAYTVTDEPKLKQSFTYNSGGANSTIVMDDSYIILRDRTSPDCQSCTQSVIHTLDDNNTFSTTNIESKYVSLTYVGNSKFITRTTESIYNQILVELKNNKIEEKFTFDGGGIITVFNGNFYHTDDSEKKLCLSQIGISGLNKVSCLNADNISLRTNSHVSSMGNDLSYIADNALYYFDPDNSSISYVADVQSGLGQFGWLDGQLVGLTENSYVLFTDSTKKTTELLRVMNTNLNLQNKHQKAFFNGDKVSHFEYYYPNVKRSTYTFSNGSFTLTDSHILTEQGSQVPGRIIYSDDYYISTFNTIKINGVDKKRGFYNEIPLSKVKTQQNKGLDSLTIDQSGTHLDNIIFIDQDSRLNYFHAQASDAITAQQIQNAQKFATYNNFLFVAYNNSLRKYNWQNNSYIETESLTGTGCALTAKVSGLSVSEDKAFVVMYEANTQLKARRNFLCIYDLSNSLIKFETQLEIPTAATGESLFNMKGRDLYGVIGNDGRLFHYQQNFAPTFATNVTVKEDSNSSSLIALNDAENDTLALQITKPATQGNASIVGNQISYAPKANYHGNDIIGVKATDAVGNVTEQDVNITITPLNDLPVIDALQFTVSQNEKYSGQFKATDVDGDKLSFTALTQPKLGLLTLNNDGSFSYQPSQSGDDSFEIKVSDGNGGESKTQVSIKVSASTSTGGSTSEPAKTESSGGGSTGFFSLILLSALAWRRRQVN